MYMCTHVLEELEAVYLYILFIEGKQLSFKLYITSVYCRL